MSKFYDEKGEPRIVRPTGNYDEDFNTAVTMYLTGHKWYIRFLNDVRNKHNIIKIKSNNTEENWFDFFDFKNKVEEYASKNKADLHF